MSTRLERLAETLGEVFGERIRELISDRGEVTVVVAAKDYLDVARTLRDDERLSFEQLVDLTALDYSAYAGVGREGYRFASVAHLLSFAHNWRVRVRVFAEDDEFPVVASVTSIWPGVNWFEREAFDLFGVHYDGHPDLRRILTDYGFVGHPFRKDFPISGYVEMRYDPEQGRVVYQPVTIAPREITPRIVRESAYGDVDNG